VKDEVLQITTPHDAQSVMEIRIYDCRDLLQMQAGLGTKEQPPLPGTGEPMAVSDHSERAAQLMNIISTNVDWHSWVKNLGAMGGMGMGGMAMPGGRGEQELKRRGSISEYNGLIVVTQTAQTHKKIEHVLDMLRQAAELPAAGAGKVIR